MKKQLITSALLYVNGLPHLGHLVGCLLPADVYARYRRSLGDEVLFIGGTDEHGTVAEVGSVGKDANGDERCCLNASPTGYWGHKPDGGAWVCCPGSNMVQSKKDSTYWRCCPNGQCPAETGKLGSDTCPGC